MYTVRAENKNTYPVTKIVISNITGRIIVHDIDMPLPIVAAIRRTMVYPTSITMRELSICEKTNISFGTYIFFIMDELDTMQPAPLVRFVVMNMNGNKADVIKTQKFEIGPARIWVKTMQ